MILLTMSGMAVFIQGYYSMHLLRTNISVGVGGNGNLASVCISACYRHRFARDTSTSMHTDKTANINCLRDFCSVVCAVVYHHQMVHTNVLNL